jgi:hypothetical protein
MDISMRSMLAAGVTAVTASAIVCAPAITPPSIAHSEVSRPIQLSAAAQTLTRQQVSSALAEIKTFVPAVGGAAAKAAAVGGPTTLNAASNTVDAVYQSILYWTDYFALDLAPYVLGWIPIVGGLITNQIYAIYPPVIDFTDSVVYDLIDPVLNDPLNLAVWANGISAVAYTAGASVINVGINEVNVVINYVLGWLPPLPPIPPIPPWTLSTAAVSKTFAATAQAELTSIPALVKAALAPVQQGLEDATTAIKDAVGSELPAPTPVGTDTEAAVVAPKVIETTVTKEVPSRASRLAAKTEAVAAAADDSEQAEAATPKQATTSDAKPGKQTSKAAKAAHSAKGAAK